MIYAAARYYVRNLLIIFSNSSNDICPSLFWST